MQVKADTGGMQLGLVTWVHCKEGLSKQSFASTAYDIFFCVRAAGSALLMSVGGLTLRKYCLVYVQE